MEVATGGMGFRIDRAESRSSPEGRAEAVSEAAESAWHLLMRNFGTLAETARLLSKLDAVRAERRALNADQSAVLSEARSRMKAVRQAIAAVGANLRASGIPPERLVPALRESLHIQQLDENPALPVALASKAITWGIEGYYGAEDEPDAPVLASRE
jgi:hypothetical protein